jgi:hypothetical protein
LLDADHQLERLEKRESCPNIDEPGLTVDGVSQGQVFEGWPEAPIRPESSRHQIDRIPEGSEQPGESPVQFEAESAATLLHYLGDQTVGVEDNRFVPEDAGVLERNGLQVRPVKPAKPIEVGFVGSRFPKPTQVSIHAHSLPVDRSLPSARSASPNRVLAAKIV